MRVYNDRPTGKTTKAIVKGVFKALNGKDVIITTSISHYNAKEMFHKALAVIDALDLSSSSTARAASNKILFSFGGSITVMKDEMLNEKVCHLPPRDNLIVIEDD